MSDSDDLLKGLGTDDTPDFADASARIRERISAAIGEQTPAAAPSSAPQDGGPEPPLYVTPDTIRPARERPWARYVGAAAVAAALLGAVVWWRVEATPTPTATSPRMVSELVSMVILATESSSTGEISTSPLTVDLTVLSTRDGQTVRQTDVYEMGFDGTSTETKGAVVVESGDRAGEVLAEADTVPAASPGPFGGLSLAELAELPTDPDELVTFLEDRLGLRADSAELAQELAAIAATERAAVGARVAAIEVLAAISTSEHADGRDPDGRTGVMVVGPDWAVLLNPISGRTLAFAREPTIVNPQLADHAATWTLWPDHEPPS